MPRVFVNQQTGSDFNPGTEGLPYMTISAAISSPANSEIFISDGIFTEQIDASRFDQIRRKIIGIGDVYIASQGNKSSFTDKLINNHLFKNIKFVNYTDNAIQFGGGMTVLSSCFFKPLQTSGSKAILINPSNASSITTLDIRKCTFINNETIFGLNSNFSSFIIKNMENNLFFGQTFHLRSGPSVQSFSSFVSSNNDKGNYYNNNIHLANGGIDSNTGENPPLFVDANGGNYDLQTISTLIGAGYLGSDIGSFHDTEPISNSSNEPFSIFDWQNDNSYFDIRSQTVGPDGPSNAAGIIKFNINDVPRWILDIANTPGGKSGRLLSPVLDLNIVRTITRASWAAIENSTLAAGNKQIINNSNGPIPDLEIRGDTNIFGTYDGSPNWTSFTKKTDINLLARYVQLRAVFRLNG